MDSIPQIKPKYEVEEIEEEGSILIPKINFKNKSDGEKRDDESNLSSADRKIAWYHKKWVRISGIVLLSLFLISGVLGLTFFNVYKKAFLVKQSFSNLASSINSQDFDAMNSELENTKLSVDKLDKSYGKIYWMRMVPFLGGYIKDAHHAIKAASYALEAGEIVMEVIEPYADVIGFISGGEQASSGEETAQDRIDFIVKTIPDLIPRTDGLIAKVRLIREEIDQVNPERYPEELAGFKVKENIVKAVENVDTASDLIENSKPLLEKANYLMGVDEERTYLVIFQNDKELRPTGGFITAYSIAKVNKGKFEPVTSSDIYNLDNNYTPKVPASEPIIKYIGGPYTISKSYRLRDMNWSPDFSESMRLFSQEIKSAGINGIDGIIAVDTQLLVNILDVVGVVMVPGYGGYSTETVELCNCPQVVYELENFADVEGPIVWSENEPGKIVFAPANYDNRKKIIGPMMNSILANAMGLTSDKVPALFGALIKSVLEKHVLFYLFDDETQAAVKSFGLAGTLDEYDGDYLQINDANLGGRKSNLYVTQEVSQNISVGKDGSVTKILTITYKNPEKYDGWLNSVLPNYVRIYVPKGSELIDFSGVEEKAEPYEELGKTVFAGFFELRPQGVAKVEIQYKLPFKVSDNYRLLIQKQPGTDSPLYTINIGKKSDEFFLNSDKELKFGI